MRFFERVLGLPRRSETKTGVPPCNQSPSLKTSQFFSKSLNCPAPPGGLQSVALLHPSPRRMRHCSTLWLAECGIAPPTGVSALQHLFAPRLITEDAVVEKDRFVSSFSSDADGGFHPVKVVGQVIEVAGKTVLLMGGKTDGIPVDR